MAIIRKINPVGVDDPIDKLQVALFNGLTWSGSVSGYESYHRGYKNESNDGRLPEVFTSNNDYKEVFMDNKFSATSFFLVDDRETVGQKVKSEVNIIFQLNLKELYRNITHRADEEARKDVYDVLYSRPDIGKITSIVKGIRNVYEDLRITQVNFDDMQPLHVFKLTMDVHHTMINC
jgi:hypothetical protein